MPSGRRETRSQSPESSKQRCTRARSTVCPAATFRAIETGRKWTSWNTAVTASNTASRLHAARSTPFRKIFPAVGV